VLRPGFVRCLRLSSGTLAGAGGWSPSVTSLAATVRRAPLASARRRVTCRAPGAPGIVGRGFAVASSPLSWCQAWRARGFQALISLRPAPPLTSMRRGLAFSAIGILMVNTPAS
jgi:hypothetical protein